MKPARIVLLVVAIMAGGLAAFLATRGDRPQNQTADAVKVVEEPRAQVLVASRAIGLGERLTAGAVQWQDWPKNAVRAEYVTHQNLPDAPSSMAGAVARFEIFPGEPITSAKLVRTDQGYLSAVLSEGMRAVSIPVTPESGAGGFIVPNDRVDVVSTHNSPNGEISETVLSNVRVLAIGKRLGETGATAQNADPNDPNTKMFDRQTIATFELDPGQAETVINAAAKGRITLILRSVADFGGGAEGASPRAGKAVKLIRFGREQSVQSTTTVGEDQGASVNPAAFVGDGIRSTMPTVTGPLVDTNSTPASGGDSTSPAVQ
ncbi:MAG TPA: Flp pilus assembly protein CpaB [Devosiaceae bacterium]